MAVVLPSPASILVRSSRSSTLAVPQFLPLSSSAASSSSASSSSDFNRSSRRIRFAPLPEPRYEYETHIDECVGDTDADTHHDASDSDQSDDLALATKHTIIDVHDVHPPPAPAPTKPLPVPQSSSAYAPSRASKFWHSLPFFRRSPSSPHASPSHLPSASHSRAVSAPPLTTTSGSTVPSHKQLHISTDVHGPRNSPRGRSPPPSAASPAASTSSAFHRTISRTSVQSCPDVAKDKHERRASSILSPGAGGGRHTFSTKMVSGLSRPSTAPSPLSRPSTAPSNGTRNAGRKHVKLLNGRVYGAKGSQANPFETAREEPEFVEWGYGGMGSVRASRDVGSAVWKGLHSSSGSPISPTTTATASLGTGGGRSPAGRRRMSQAAPACGMGNVSSGGGDGDDGDDGTGMGWVKRRREARERAAQEKAEREASEKQIAVEREKEPRRSGESLNASMRSTSASSGTTATTTGASGTEASSPVTSTRTSVTDLSSPGGVETKPVQQHIPRRGSEDHRVFTTPLNPPRDRKTNGSETSSPIESEQASPSSVRSRPYEDDEDYEVELKRTKTSMGARMEKVSRHHGGGGGADP